MSKILLTILFFSLIIGETFCQYLTLNFKTNINLSSINEQNYMKSSMEQQIYVDLNIGKSNQIIPMTLKTMKYPTFVVSSRSSEEDIQIKYDETKSEYFKYLTEGEINNLFIYDFTKGYYVSDSLDFNSSLNYNNFRFILASKMNGLAKNISGEIGFSKKIENKNNYLYPQKTNFLQQLIENRFIDRKSFGIKYDSEYEGRLIIGTTLDAIDSSYKKEEQNIIELDNDVPNNNKDNWLLKFRINFKKNEEEEHNETSYGFLQYEIGLIYGSNSYRNNFIVKYFQNKGCTENVVNSSPYSFYQYTCINENQYSDFPNLTFSLSSDNKYNFTFNKDDLFKKVGNKYFFLVVFQVTNMDINYWRLGQLFFRKYPMFLFEGEGKKGQIIYFSNNKKKEGGDDDESKTDENTDNNTDDGDNSGSKGKGNEGEKDDGGNVGLVVALSIIIPLIVIAIVIFIIYHYKRRKKTTEELMTDKLDMGDEKNYPIINN